MAEITKENKEKLKALEGAIKAAFSEGRFGQVTDLAKSIRSVDPENRLATKLLEKIESAKAEAKAKENTAKIKQYQEMLGKMLKDGNFANVRKLAEELKGLDPKSAADWLKKAADAEAKIKREQNAVRIKEIEKQIKTSFKEARFDEVRILAEKLKELDSGNSYGEKMVAKSEEVKAEVKRKENADKINALQDQIKLAFKESRFTDLGKIANKLFEIDPQNSFAKKYLAKSVEAQEKAQKARSKAEEAKAGPEAKTVKPAEKKEGFFAKLFKKSEEKKPAEEKKPPVISAQPVKPAAPLKPVAPIKPLTAEKPAVTPQPVELKLTEPAAEPKEPTEAKRAEALKGEKGNIFTKMFGKAGETEKTEKSIIDTIVAKTEEKAKKPAVKKEPREEGMALLKFGSGFLKFAVIFILISAAFFYVENIDENNTVLGLAGIESNYAGRLHNAGLTLEGKKDEEQQLNRDVSKFKKGYDNKYETVIKGIVDKRMDWSDMIAKVNEVANAVYERNEISQYIKFNSYSFDVNSGQVRVSGSLSDPLGKNLTKLVELENAFEYYPRDPNNPDDKTEPYFYNFQELNSLSKSYDKKTGKYTSTLSLSFSLKPTNK